MNADTPTIKERLAAGDQLIGALLRLPNEDLVELLGVAGMDFILIDCEHGPADVLALRRHIALADLHRMGVLVRIGHKEPALALRAMDQGAQGIVAPHIDTAADAQALVDSVHYPPLGHRGFATYTRTGRFGTVPAEAHRARTLESTLVVAMLESPTAVGNAQAILTTTGVDAFLVGPADLAASSTPDDPAVPDAIDQVRATAAAAGAGRMDLVGNAQAAAESVNAGANLVVYNLTQVLMDTFSDLRIDT